MGEPEDGPGTYVVLNKAVVTRDRTFQGEHSVVAKVDVGVLIRVLEVEESAEDMRLRALIEEPAGWMSLLNTQTGRRWAQRALLCPRNHRLTRGMATCRWRCAACAGGVAPGAQLLRCVHCGLGICTGCLAADAGRKAWTFQASAGIGVEVLGFNYEILTPFRMLISAVEAGSWADSQGLQVGDEVVATNGVRVEKIPAEELADLFERVRPVAFTLLWDGHEADAPAQLAGPPAPAKLGGGADDVAHRMSVAKPQFLDGRPVAPPFWGVSRAQCGELLRELRRDSAWQSSGTMEELVTGYISPLTKGTGLGYALWKNQGAPREANVVVSCAWRQNAEDLLETVLRSTYAGDVLFITALALYQAEDGAGPSIADQVGADPSAGPLHRALTNIAARSAGTGCCRRRLGLLRVLAPLLLWAAAALFWTPIVFWGCVPAPDFSRCAARTHPDGGWAQRVEWHWLPEYVQDGAMTSCILMYAGSFGLIIAGAVLKFMIHFHVYRGRLLAVPCHEEELSGRLWSFYFISVARKLEVPASLASSLVPAGSGRVWQATCASASDEERLRRLIEDGSVSRGAREADRAVRTLLCRHRWAVRLVALQWIALFTLLRSADLRLVANDPWRWDSGPLLCVLGTLAGAALFATEAYGLFWRPGAALRAWALCVAPLLLLMVGSSILLVLALTERLRLADFGGWSTLVDLLSDEAYRHSACTTTPCQRIVAFSASFAQTLVVSGINLAVFIIGAVCCPQSLKRWHCVAATFAGIFLAGVAAAVWVARSVTFHKGFPRAEFVPAVVVFYLTQVLARCAVPLGALCSFAACYGCPARGQRRKVEASPPGKDLTPKHALDQEQQEVAHAGACDELPLELEESRQAET